MARGPENTVAAMKQAWSDGAAAVECDIRRTSDGQFVAFHDSSTGRLCPRDWEISNNSWAHLKALRVLDKEPIAHLDDILNLMILRPGLEVYFELSLPRDSDAADFALQLNRAGMQYRSYLLVFQNRISQLEAASAAVPDIGRAVMPFLPSDLTGIASRAGASRVCTGWVDWPLTKQLFYLGASLFDFKLQAAEAAAAGVEVSAGVANNPRDVRALAELGAHAIWTDDVPMAMRYLGL